MKPGVTSAWLTTVPSAACHADGLELKLKDTYEKIGIENDEELMKQLNIDQSLMNAK